MPQRTQRKTERVIRITRARDLRHVKLVIVGTILTGSIHCQENQGAD